MRALWEQWQSQRAALRAEMPDAQTYLLLDAAQLPFNAMPWRDMLASGETSNLLAGQPEASHPEVCALLTNDAAAWTDALVATHLARRPFAFMLLHSDRPQPALARVLARATVAKLPEREKGLLRYYDAAVFQTLMHALPAQRRQTLLSCAKAWTFVGRDGRIQTVRHERGDGQAAAPLDLDSANLAALHLHGTQDRVMAQLKKNGRLPLDADPFDTYAKLGLLVHEMSRAGIVPSDAQLYRCSALAINHPLTQWQADLPALFERHAHDQQALSDALADWASE